MNMKKTICLLCGFILLGCLVSHAQDSVSMINGKYYRGKLVSYSDNETVIRFHPEGKKKNKIRVFDKQDVFSVHFSDSAHRVFYFMDADLGNEMTLEEMSAFVHGEQYATRYYRCRWVIPAGVLAGMGGVYWGFWGLSVPAAYFAGVSATSVSIRNKDYLPEDLKKDEYFVNGFKYKAKRKKMNNAIIGGLAGVAVMGAVSAVITGLYYFD